MALVVAARDLGPNIREIAAVESMYKQAGIDSTTFVTGKGGSGPLRGEEEHTNRGLFGLPLRETHSAFDVFRSDLIGTAPRWTGGNFGGYSNPEYDRLFNASLLAFNVGERNRLLAGALKILAEDAVAINLFYDMAQQTVVFRKGVRGPVVTSPEQNAAAWNIHSWEMD